MKLFPWLRDTGAFSNVFGFPNVKPLRCPPYCAIGASARTSSHLRMLASHGNEPAVPFLWDGWDSSTTGCKSVETSGLAKHHRVQPLLPEGFVPLDTKLLDENAVTLEVLLLQVVEQTPALTDELHESLPRVMVLGVGLEMLGQVADALAQDCHLHLG